MTTGIRRGRNGYTGDWAQIACRVKDDAQHMCVRCRAVNNHATGHVLTVHHFDGDKANNARWNLMALCQRCHLSVQGRVDPRVPLLMEPAVWAMPYIAGMYESGAHSPPGPLYDLQEWMRQFERERGEWPAWAPRSQEGTRQ